MWKSHGSPERVSGFDGRHNKTTGLDEERAEISAGRGCIKSLTQSRRVPWGVANAFENDHQRGQHRWLRQQAQTGGRGNEIGSE